MVSLDVLHRKSLFALLHTLDVDLAEATRTQGCPTVRVRSTEARMCGSLGAALRISRRRSPFA
jgi:hypothetical protein